MVVSVMYCLLYVLLAKTHMLVYVILGAEKNRPAHQPEDRWHRLLAGEPRSRPGRLAPRTPHQQSVVVAWLLLRVCKRQGSKHVQQVVPGTRDLFIRQHRHVFLNQIASLMDRP